MRSHQIGLLAAMLGLAVPLQAQQNFPSRPIRIIIPSTPGSTQDILARLIGPKLTDSFRQPVVVENRPGASGILGIMQVVKATPDGYTLMAMGPGYAVLAATRDNLPYDALKDLRGVAQIGYNTAALLVYPGLGVKSVKELIAYAQARPGKILFGASAAGSSTHMNGERFRLVAGIQARHVGFKGQPEFLIEIAAGRVQFGVSGIGAAMSLIKNGQLLPLAITSQKRAATLPDVPTSAEVLPGWGNDGSHALYAPAATPRLIIHQLNREVARALDAPELRERLSTMDFNIHTLTPDEFDKTLQNDIALFTRIAREAGLRAK